MIAVKIYIITKNYRLYIPVKQHDRPRGTACHSASNCMIAVNV